MNADVGKSALVLLERPSAVEVGQGFFFVPASSLQWKSPSPPPRWVSSHEHTRVTSRERQRLALASISALALANCAFGSCLRMISSGIVNPSCNGVLSVSGGVKV